MKAERRFESKSSGMLDAHAGSRIGSVSVQYIAGLVDVVGENDTLGIPILGNHCWMVTLGRESGKVWMMRVLMASCLNSHHIGGRTSHNGGNLASSHHT
jgi:hypothetical protein